MSQQRLRGNDLVAYVRANPGLPEKELAAGAGYYTDLEDGKRQVNTKPFYQELSLASGVVAPSTIGRKTIRHGSGRGLSYNLKTNEKSGNAVLTGGYLRQIGVQPGERVSVEVIEEAGEIVLKAYEVSENGTFGYAADDDETDSEDSLAELEEPAMV